MDKTSFFSRLISSPFNKKLKLYLPAFAFTFGFVFDLATLDRIDNWTSFTPQAFYLIICTAFLVLAFEEDPAVKNKDAQSKAVTFFLKYQGEIFHFLLIN